MFIFPFIGDEYQYKKFIGILLYLTTTRQDIVVAIQQHGQRISQTRVVHFKDVIYVFKKPV